MNKHSPCVAVIDDDQAVLRALVRLLKSMGCAALPYSSAAAFLAEMPPDLTCAVVDVQMPGMTGPQLKQKLDSLGFNVPVIFITAHEDAQCRQRALESGAAGFFYKPITRAMLSQALGGCDRPV